MKHEIIYIDDCALIVSDEEIKEGDWVVDKHDVVYKQETDKIFTKFNGAKKIIAHRPLTDVVILKGIPLLPEFSQPKRPKYFEMEVYFYDNPVYNTYPKTKLISKCQTEVVGEYSYE